MLYLAIIIQREKARHLDPVTSKSSKNSYLTDESFTADCHPFVVSPTHSDSAPSV